jgi:endonuclease-3
MEPAPTTELTWTDPYTLLVAVVLSAQATDISVNRATDALFKLANTPQKMLELGEERLLGYIKGINLYRGKAKNVIGLSKALIEKHGGEVPPDRVALEALPGVGRKTANVVLNTAFGEPLMGVDTHILRVCNRTGLAPGKNPREVEINLEEVVPDRYRRYAHHWLLLHGRYVCKARVPECWRCLIRDICLFKPKTPPPA